MMSDEQDNPPPPLELVTTGSVATPTTVAMPPGSELAEVLRSLPPGMQALLGVNQHALATLDLAVAAARTIIDDTDERSLDERFGWLPAALADLDPDGGVNELLAWLSDITTRDAVIGRIRRLKDGSWRRFLHRLLGAAVYDRLAAAGRADGEAVGEAVQWASERVKPFAVAFDDCMRPLPPDEMRRLVGIDGLPASSTLETLLKLDGAVAKLMALRREDPATDLVETSSAAGHLPDLVEELRTATSGPTRQALGELNGLLGRKLEGARAALESSPDGVSQAANSLVELIDRMLRTAFPPAEVLDWLTATGRQGKLYVHYVGDNRDIPRPTKRAEALCFVYGGQVTAPSSVLEALGEAVPAMRNELQKLKHADTAIESEVVKVRNLTYSVEAFITLVVRIGWAIMGADRIEEIRRRFAA